MMPLIVPLTLPLCPPQTLPLNLFLTRENVPLTLPLTQTLTLPSPHQEPKDPFREWPNTGSRAQAAAATLALPSANGVRSKIRQIETKTHAIVDRAQRIPITPMHANTKSPSHVPRKYCT